MPRSFMGIVVGGPLRTPSGGEVLPCDRDDPRNVRVPTDAEGICKMPFAGFQWPGTAEAARWVNQWVYFGVADRDYRVDSFLDSHTFKARLIFPESRRVRENAEVAVYVVDDIVVAIAFHGSSVESLREEWGYESVNYAYNAQAARADSYYRDVVASEDFADGSSLTVYGNAQLVPGSSGTSVRRHVWGQDNTAAAQLVCEMTCFGSVADMTRIGPWAPRR